MDKLPWFYRGELGACRKYPGRHWHIVKVWISSDNALLSVQRDLAADRRSLATSFWGRT